MEHAQALKAQKQWAQAAEAYRAEYQESNDIEALAEAAWCASLAKNYEDAIAWYQDLTRLRPENAKWLYNLGYQYYTTKKTRQAIHCFEQSLAQNPSALPTKYRLASALYSLCNRTQPYKNKEFFTAIEQLNGCDQLYNSMSADEQEVNRTLYKKCCIQKGKMLMENRQWQQALENFQRAEQLSDKPDIDCAYHISKILKAQGKEVDALHALPEVNMRYDITELRADLLWQLGEHYEALRVMQLAVKQRNSDALNRKLSTMYFELADYPSAFSWAQNALKINPDNHKNHYCIGLVYEQLGLLDMAEKEASAAIETKRRRYKSDFPLAAELLERIQTQKGGDYPGDDRQLIESLKPEDSRQTGQIEKYDPVRKFGFIQTEDARYFFHFNQVNADSRANIQAGATASFEVGANHQGTCAVQIQIEK